MTNEDAYRGMRLTHEQRIAWLRLIRAGSIGPATFRELVNHHGSAQAVLDVLPDLAQRGGNRAITIPSVAQAEAELYLIEKFGARLVALGEPDYPPALAAISAPPPLLSVLGGDPALFRRHCVGIVGSRNASIAGQKMTDRLARGLGEEGIIIVSGLARGIDAAAHRATVNTGTIAVIAGGIDHIYPEDHAPLLRQIVDAGGAIVSEMPFGWKPRAQDFPRRNRIISGISIGILVVEAAARSGTLHTARYALEQGRTVFAVPGSPLDPRAEGTNNLIRQGAELVISADQVMESLRPMMGGTRVLHSVSERGQGELPLDTIEDSAFRVVVELLGPVPVAIDDIVLHTGFQPQVVFSILLDLELAGRIERHGNQLVSLIR
jgi:DNA processing protein